ncbi:MAG: hypothetical protein AB7O43_02725 [Hyphomicrobiaceae bacterium]
MGLGQADREGMDRGAFPRRLCIRHVALVNALPVAAGLITHDGERYNFNYGRSYLERKNGISLFELELPLRRGLIAPLDGVTLAGCLRDGAPDACSPRVS